MSKGEEGTYSNCDGDDSNTASVFHSTSIYFKRHKHIRSQGQYLKPTSSQMDFLFEVTGSSFFPPTFPIIDISLFLTR